jgi:hypothetical protein
MPNFRFGQIAKSVSGNLDLFIGREAEKERVSMEQQWQMALEDLRETRAVAREGRQEKARLADAELATRRHEATTAAATERHEATTAATAEYRSATLEQGQLQFEDSQVQKQVENHYKRVDDRYERLQKELEDPAVSLDPEAGDALRAKADMEVANMTVKFVDRMVRGDKRGFEVTNPEELSSVYMTFGVPTAVADKVARENRLFNIELIPQQITGDEPFALNAEDRAAPVAAEPTIQPSSNRAGQPLPSMESQQPAPLIPQTEPSGSSVFNTMYGQSPVLQELDRRLGKVPGKSRYRAGSQQ